MTTRQYFSDYSSLSNKELYIKLRSLESEQLVQTIVLLFGAVRNLETAMCFAEGVYIKPEDKIFCIDCDKLFKQIHPDD